jgi:hypothetical protein
MVPRRVGARDRQSVPACAEFLRTIEGRKNEIVEQGAGATIDTVTRTVARGNRDVVRRPCQASPKTKALETCRRRLGGARRRPLWPEAALTTGGGLSSLRRPNEEGDRLEGFLIFS